MLGNTGTAERSPDGDAGWNPRAQPRVRASVRVVAPRGGSPSRKAQRVIQSSVESLTRLAKLDLEVMPKLSR